MNIKNYLNLKTVGYCILGYAGVSYLAASTGAIQGVGASWYNQLFLTIVAGLGSIFLDGKKVTIWNILAKVVSLITGKKPDAPVITDDVFDALAQVAEALNKAGDTEGVALCKSLNGRLFDATYTVKKVEVVDNATK